MSGATGVPTARTVTSGIGEPFSAEDTVPLTVNRGSGSSARDWVVVSSVTMTTLGTTEPK